MRTLTLLLFILPLLYCMLLLEILLWVMGNGSDILNGKKVKLNMQDWFGED